MADMTIEEKARRALELCEGASEGPWSIGKIPLNSPHGRLIPFKLKGPIRDCDVSPVPAVERIVEMRNEDARFVAESRALLPDLAQTVLGLTAERAELHKGLSALNGIVDAVGRKRMDQDEILSQLDHFKEQTSELFVAAWGYITERNEAIAERDELQANLSGLREDARIVREVADELRAEVERLKSEGRTYRLALSETNRMPGEFCRDLANGLPQPRLWLLTFADQDKGVCYFDNAAEARAAFHEANQSWTCDLWKSERLKAAPVVEPGGFRWLDEEWRGSDRSLVEWSGEWPAVHSFRIEFVCGRWMWDLAQDGWSTEAEAKAAAERWAEERFKS